MPAKRHGSRFTAGEQGIADTDNVFFPLGGGMLSVAFLALALIVGLIVVAH